MWKGGFRLAEEYTYAISRVRAKELSLLTQQDLEQLMECQTEEECLQILYEKGWGKDGERETILSVETCKTWEFLRELVPDLTGFRIFLIPADYHNLKTAIKSVVTDRYPERRYLLWGTIEPDVLEEAVRNHRFSDLPEDMQASAAKAFETLLHTRDGQLCDTVLDRAALLQIQKAGRQSENHLIQRYAELLLATSNIKIAVRGQKLGKPLGFFQEAMAPCESLDIGDLARAAVSGQDAVMEYLSHTDYAQGVEALAQSSSAFEKWCDDNRMKLMKTQKTNPFTIGPLVAYLLARETEIKAVRLILSGKRNRLDDRIVKERLRDLYV